MTKFVETRVQQEILNATENLVIPRVGLTMKSVIASSWRGIGSVLLDPDERNLSGNVEGLQVTASSRKNSHTDVIRFDETRGNIDLGGGEFSVNERHFDWPTHTHHTYA